MHETYGHDRSASVGFIPDFPISRAAETSGVWVDVASNLEEEIAEEGKRALITALGGEDQVLVVFLHISGHVSLISEVLMSDSHRSIQSKPNACR